MNLNIRNKMGKGKRYYKNTTQIGSYYTHKRYTTVANGGWINVTL